MMNVLVIYLTSNVGFSDIKSGSWVGIFTLLITIFTFLVGSVCDTIGIKKTMYIGLAMSVISRLMMGFFSTTPIVVISSLVLLSLGTAFLSPIMSTAIRRYTFSNLRSTGFNVYYLIMNIGAMLAGFAVTDGLRNMFGPEKGNLAIMVAGGLFNLACLGFVYILREHHYCEESEKLAPVKLSTSSILAPFKNIISIWKEKPFQILILFLVLTLGVRLIFSHQFFPLGILRIVQLLSKNPYSNRA